MPQREEITVTFGLYEAFDLEHLLSRALTDNAALQRGLHPQGAAMLKFGGYRALQSLRTALTDAGHNLGEPPLEELDEHDQKLFDDWLKEQENEGK